MSATNSLVNLLRKGTLDDHEQILDAADNALNSAPSDVQAQHVKAVALLKLDRFDEAIQVLQAGGNALQQEASRAYAYALYKTGKPAEAAKVATQADDRGARHLEAQASYKAEDFDRASDIYNSLAAQRGQVSNENVDLRINLSAVDAQLQWAGRGHLVKSTKPSREDLEAFETAYNAACGCIARGELPQAEILLKRSKDLCEALDDLSAEDKKAETFPIIVQQIYVLLRLGRSADAAKLSAELDAASTTDKTLTSIASINELNAVDVENPFLLQRRLAHATSKAMSEEPFRYQALALQKNRHAGAMSAQKFKGTSRTSRSAARKYAEDPLNPAVTSLSALSAAAAARGAKGRAALRLLLPELTKRPNDLGLILTVVQLYVLTGNTDMAVILLQKFLDRLSSSTKASDLELRYAPGLVATIISLYTLRGQRKHIRSELARAAQHWRQNLNKDPSARPSAGVTNLLKSAGAALITSTSPSDTILAAETFSSLSALHLSDPYITAGQQISDPNPSTILTPITKLISSINATTLEEAGIAKPPTTIKTTASSRPKRALAPESTTAPAAKKQRTHIKPSKRPRDFDPSKTPDPERWLPARDRSGYKPPRNNKAKKGGKRDMFAQGAVDDAAAQGKDKSTPAAGMLEGKQAAGGKSGGGAKKKKGKGGKW